MTISEKYNELKTAFSVSAEIEAEAEARQVLSLTQGCPQNKLLLRFSEPCQNEGEIDMIAQKRLSGMPLAYAMNSQPFYGRDHYVDQSVLIPRCDTECVVEQAVGLIQKGGYQTALDLCCGSGCIGVALLLESPAERVDFADASAEALYVAEQNLRKLAPDKEGYCAFYEGDLFAPVKYAYDIIACNPPYISGEEYESLEPQVKDHEPKSALYAGSGGYEFYERLAAEAARFLNPGGSLVVEIGDTQKNKVSDLLAQAGFTNIECGADLAGRDRWVSACAPEGEKG